MTVHNSAYDLAQLAAVFRDGEEEDRLSTVQKLSQEPEDLGERPLVVDVDNDGQSEIVVINNNYAYGTKTGVTVYGDKDKSWRPARKIWNQHAYYITNSIRVS